MHLILTGATGLCGSGVLDAMIKMKNVTKISIISRRPVKMAEDVKDPRINVIIHNDFEKYDSELLRKLTGATGCVWALGISQNQVGKEEYVKITKDFSLRAAEAFQTLGSETQPFNFVYVSSDMTTQQPGRFTPFFARVKGETETKLAEMRKANPSFQATSIRPSFIDSAAHGAIHPYIPAQGVVRNGLNLVLGPLVRSFVKSIWAPTEHLGPFMTEMAMGRWDTQLQGPGVEKLGDLSIVSNAAFRRLAGLDRN